MMKNKILFTGAAVSAQGSSHIKTNKPCQDRCDFVCCDMYSAIMVFDGHGGDKHFRSEQGAELAKEVCLRELPDFSRAILSAKDEKTIYRHLKDFEKHLIFSWRDEVENELIINPFTETELSVFNDEEIAAYEKDPHVAFGSTLLLAVACNLKLFIIQLGDGDCRIMVNNELSNPIEEDETLKFGKTSSLCNPDAYDRIRDVILPIGSIDACLLSSDGVFNSFDTEEHYSGFCKVLLTGLNDPDTDIQAELGVFLPKLSSKGSADDVSVALMHKFYIEELDVVSHLKNLIR